MCEHSLVIISLCLAVHHTYTEMGLQMLEIGTSRVCVLNARFKTEILKKKMYIFSYNISGLPTEGLLSHIPNTSLSFAALKGYVSVHFK